MKWCGYNWDCKMDGYRTIHPKQPWQWYSLDAIDSKDDTLSLNVLKVPNTITHDGIIYYPIYEVATMRSLEDFLYGTFSCEMKMPKGRNLSASFWLTGSGNWPPEIDIMEGFLGNNRKWFHCFQKYFPWIKLGWSTTNNVVYRDERMEKTHIGSRNIPYLKQPFKPDDWFIEYKCKWEPNKITFYANNKIVREVTGFECQQLTKNIENPEKEFKMNVIFNVWVENPNEHIIEVKQPMKIRNFRYEKL